jgi:hypothetical protein
MYLGEIHVRVNYQIIMHVQYNNKIISIQGLEYVFEMRDIFVGYPGEIFTEYIL